MVKYKVVFSDWVALELKEKGFNFIVRPDRKNPEQIVYVFKATPEFLVAFKQVVENYGE